MHEQLVHVPMLTLAHITQMCAHTHSGKHAPATGGHLQLRLTFLALRLDPHHVCVGFVQAWSGQHVGRPAARS